MSWLSPLRRAGFACLCGVGIAGCGFQPLYGSPTKSAAGDASLAAIEVDQIHDRLGQVLTNQLRDGVSPTSRGVPARYRLEVSLSKQVNDSAVRSDGTASHTAIRISAAYVLRRLSDGAQATAGSVHADNGLDVLDNQYANTIGQKTDELRAVHDVGEQILERIAIYLRQPPAVS